MKFRVYIAGIVTILAAFIIVILSACIVDIKAASKDGQQTVQISSEDNIDSEVISNKTAQAEPEAAAPADDTSEEEVSEVVTADAALTDTTSSEEELYPELRESYNSLVEKYNSIVNACQEASLTEDATVKEVLTQAADIITEIGNTDLETATEDDIEELTESIDLMMLLLDQIIDRAELTIDNTVKADYEKPDFTVTTTGGEQFTLSEQGGNIVVLSFFATWCSPCREELAILQDISNDFCDSNVKIISICCGADNTETAKFLKNNGLTFMAAGDFDGQISADYDVSAIPYTVVFDETGSILAEFEGLHTADEYRKVLEK